MTRYLYPFLLLLLLVPPAAAQSTNVGHLAVDVYDSRERRLPGATVRIAGTNISGTTNADGRAELRNIPPGTYSVSASAPGFAGQTEEGVRIVAGQTADLSFFLYPLPTGITVLSPNGGESWDVSRPQEIRWSSANIGSTVSISLYRGRSQVHDFGSTANDGLLAVELPRTLAPASDYVVRVSGRENLSGELFSDESDRPFTILPTLRLLTPEGGQRIALGATQLIQWVTNLAGPIRIELLRNNQPVQTLAASAPNTGVFSWNVATNLPEARNYTIRLTSTTSPNITDLSGAFELYIERIPFIAVTYPAGGETLTLGSKLGIAWNSYLETGGVRIDLGRNGSIIQNIVTGAPNTGRYDWTIPMSLTPGSGYFIRIMSMANTSILGESRLFSLAATATLTYEPSRLDFGSVNVGDSVRATLRLSNGGPGRLDGALSLSGSTAFYVAADSRSFQIPAGASRDLSIWFRPVAAGSASASLSVTHNASNVDTPLAIPLTGSGLALLRLNSPNGGETWTLGRNETITWQPGSSGGNVSIVLLQGAQVARTIAASTPNDGSETWTVDAGLPEGSDYRIRITTLGSNPTSDVSDGPFSILPPPSLRVVYPNGGETLTRSTRVDIRWESRRYTGPIRIELLRDGAAFQTPAASAPNTGVFAWTVPADLPPSSAYRIWVVAADGSLADASDSPFTIDVLRVTVIAPGDPGDGQTLPITVTTPPAFTPTSRTLYYRRGGERAFQQIGLGPAPGGFSASVPPAFVTERGVDYYVSLSDGLTTVTFPEVQPAQQPEHLRVRVANRTTTVIPAARAYRMISVPLNLDDKGLAALLEDDFGPYDPARWRLLRWNTGRDRYDEYPALPEIRPGMAFWLITEDGAAFDAEAGASVDASAPYGLTLAPGWNQIGNPFAFPVSWGDIALQNRSRIANFDGTIGPLVFFDGSEMRYDTLVSVLQPWEGYFVFSAAPSEIRLDVPPLEAAAPQGKTGSPDTPFEAGSYTLRISARSGPDRDSQNWIGFGEPVRWPEAPALRASLQLSLVEGGERLAALVATPEGGGRYWDVEISTPAPGRVRIHLDEQGVRPEGYDLFVLDRTMGRPITVESDGFEITTGAAPHRLRFVLGAEAFAEAHRDDVPLHPVAFGLAQNYPNPFNAGTRITYTLDQAGPVRIDVFDVLGRRVATLVNAELAAGPHDVAWDGHADTGGPLPSGLYLYRLSTAGSVASRSMLLLR